MFVCARLNHGRTGVTYYDVVVSLNITPTELTSMHSSWMRIARLLTISREGGGSASRQTSGGQTPQRADPPLSPRRAGPHGHVTSDACWEEADPLVDR